VKGPRVLALYGDENGCTLWRVWSPYMELQRRGYGAWFRDKDDPETYKPEFPYLAATRLDAIILPRFHWEDQFIARRWINALHAAGLTVIYELDDDVLTPQIGARQHATTQTDKTVEALEQDRRDRIATIRLCDGVTTTTHELAAVVGQYTDAPVRVVPNRVDLRWFRRTLRGVRRSVAPLTVGWAGGARYPEDFLNVAEAWSNIARRYPHVNFVIQGYMAQPLVSALSPTRLHKLPWLPLTEYPHALKNIDIGCASVANKHFNRCKTPIKVWEYTLAGAVTVSSPTLYDQVVTDGSDGFIAETAAEWETALARLIEDAELRRRLWRAQRRRIAEQHSLEQNVLEWPKAWQEILNHVEGRRRWASLLAG
jgi:glycosyltransferase involved in cell wall biosynthesis